MSRILVENTSSFPSTLQTELDRGIREGIPVFVLVVAAKDETTGISWCPDCVKAEPYMDKAFSDIGKCIVIECPVDKPSYKGNPDHPYKQHAGLQIQSIPTLIAWNENGPQERLVEAECYDSFMVNNFVKLFQ